MWDDHTSTALELRNLTLDSWALDKAALVELDARLWARMPNMILEFGSGFSTRVIANYARATGAQAISLEHDRTYFRRTRALLGDAVDYVDLRFAPLSGRPPMYETKMPDGIEFALVDGPPAGKGGRDASPAAISPHLAASFEVWIDDCARKDEARMAERWAGKMGLWKEETEIPRGITRLAGANQRQPVNASEVAISILTGARPEQLRSTLEALPDHLLETADQVIVFVNGMDEETVQIYDDMIASKPAINTHLLMTPTIVPAGEALGDIARKIRSPFWMHLEDDWRFCSTDDTWLDRAKAVLREDETVAQVRLRHLSEKTMDKHQVTGEKIVWYPHKHGLVTDDSHLTNNPMLVRSHEYGQFWPCKNERTMQPLAHKAGMRRVVQLHPGGFFHTGDAVSLRKRTGNW